MTLASDFASALDSALAAVLAGLMTAFESAAFDSVFLFVTGAFDFSGAGFTAALDEGLALDDVAVETGFDAVLATAFVGALFVVLALLAGLAATSFFTAGFAIDLLEAGLVAADFVFFVSGVVFAVFFIAFAMGSIPIGLLSLRNKNCVCGAGKYVSISSWPGMGPRDVSERFGLPAGFDSPGKITLRR